MPKRMNRTNPAPPTATNPEWFRLAVLALPRLIYSLDLTVLIGAGGFGFASVADIRL
jgi:hypothetical protein